MFPAASEQRKVEDEVTSLTFIVLVGCRRPEDDGAMYGSTMIVITFLKLFVFCCCFFKEEGRMILLYSLRF